MANLKNVKNGFFLNLFSLQEYKRILELDALRGFIMVIMALDHANLFIGPGKKGLEIWMGEYASFNGDFLLFFTRFITHLCAPGFFFLMGAGMIFFSMSRMEKGWSRWKIYRYFVLRGALLILLQFLIENPAWKIDMPGMPLYYGVLFGLGGSMICGILFLEIPVKLLATLSMALIILTEILLPDVHGKYVMYDIKLRMWLIPGFTTGNFVLYPIMPWLGVMGLGMVFGRFIKQESKNRSGITMILGFVLIGAFLAIRFAGGFGNIKMAPGENLISFLNVVKYPPSIALLLISLGVNMVILGCFSIVLQKKKTLLNPLVILGSTPLFFYLVHLYLYGIMGVVFASEKKTLFGMYPFWVFGILILLPLCALFGKLKQKSSGQSILRFF